MQENERHCLAIKLCSFKMDLIKWQLNFRSSKFGLKSYLWFHIELTLRAHSILESLMILDQSALHSVQLPLLNKFICFVQMFFGVLFNYYRTARKELDGHECNIVDLKYDWSQNKWLVFVVFLDLQLSSFFGRTMIFHQVAKKLLNFLYSGN